MEKKQYDLSDKLPLSVVPDQDIQCVYCGAKSYKYKETITRKNGTQAKVFKCKKCHQQFRDNYQASIKLSNKYKTGEYKKEHSACPHCHRKNYKKTGTYLRKDGTTVQRMKCKS